MPRFAYPWFLLAALLCTSCSDDDGILALNVTLADTARAATTLQVTFSQGGQVKLFGMVNVPTEPIDGGMISKTDFNERITMTGLGAGPAIVTVEAKQGTTTLATAMTTIDVELDGAVAGYVTLGKMKPVMPIDAGAGDGGE